MSALSRALGDRACRYALGAETILRVFATVNQSDWAWGLHQLVDDASSFTVKAVESGDVDLVEEASLRYAKTNALFSHIAHESDEEMLLSAESLLEMTKDMLDAEAERLMAAGVPA